MKNILETLYIYKWKIFLVLVLLFIQAFCNLALPEYTSNIVDVGIAQNGVERSVPIVIRESEFDYLKNFLEDDEKSLLEDSYIYLEKNHNDKYSILKNEGVYELKDNSDIDSLETTLLYPLFISANKEKFDIMDSDLMKKLK